MSDEKKRSLTSYPSLDPRLLSVPNLCSMYEVFSTEFFNLDPDEPDGAVCAEKLEKLQNYMDLIIDSLRIRLAENRLAEIDLGYATSAYGEEGTE